MKRVCLVAAVWLAASAVAPAQEAAASSERGPVPASMTAQEAIPARARALAWLTQQQQADGSFCHGVLSSLTELGFSIESFHAWSSAAQALACQALAHAPRTPERDLVLENGLRSLCTARLPLRGSDWDSDFLWSALCGFDALTDLQRDERFQTPAWQTLIRARGREFGAQLEANQTPEGGWAYYDDPIFSERPKWATSFCTALVLPALDEGQGLGWIQDPRTQARAIEYVRACALPNGAYSYDFTPIPRINGGEMINDLKGSLGRIQVCNWGLASAGVKQITADRLREGLEQFFSQHKFLDVARLRPVPHEAYYQNAGYFYMFGHYYAARAIELLPKDERESWHARLRPHLVKAQNSDGRSLDFHGSDYMAVASTAYTALALGLGLSAEDQ